MSDVNRNLDGSVAFTPHVVLAIGPVRDGSPRGEDCRYCDGRGWFAVDMEGTGFYHCKHCGGRGYLPPAD